MNIKKRLILFNTITGLIPILFTLIFTIIFLFIYSNLFHKDISFDNFKKLVSVKAEIFDTSNSILKQNPEAIEDSSFQQYLKKKLWDMNGEIVATKNNTIVISSKNISRIDIEKCINEANSNSIEKSIEINNITYAIEVIPLDFKDGDKGNVILLAPVGKEDNFIFKILMASIIVFIFSFIISNLIMSYIFSNRLLKPIDHLKNAASEISNGNLNCEIVEAGDSEIKELCVAFEKMRIQLKDSVRMKIKYDDNRKILISSISHDLKTPITSIKGYVEGILDGVANTPEKIDRYLKTIYSKAELVDIMIEDLLLYSKLDLHQIPFNFERADIIEYFNDCIYECAPELEKHGISISLINELTSSRFIMLDKERMRRVITNIIDNSRKYMNKPSGDIQIFIRDTTSSIIIELRDNGSGIDKNDVNKIFDRFYRADAARTDTKGSGLGLAIAKQIVEGHNGKIWAISHETEGTSILISLAKIIIE